ncbi:methyltransferase domain-containing protein [Flavobacterium sp.]
MRKPYQGIVNIVRFNWHLYLIAISMVLLLFFSANLLDSPYKIFLYTVGSAIIAAVFVSLVASYYVYDLSGLYTLDWIDATHTEKIILNINAGFDETSELLKDKFPLAKLIALDFYDPSKHTEVSIKRARNAYPPYPETKTIETNSLPLEDIVADKIMVIFAAHEIRNTAERTAFFKELHRVLKPNGKLYITEHLRDIPNALVYNIGCFHFYSKASWCSIFHQSGFITPVNRKLNPFVSTFILTKNGTTF